MTGPRPSVAAVLYLADVVELPESGPHDCPGDRRGRGTGLRSAGLHKARRGVHVGARRPDLPVLLRELPGEVRERIRPVTMCLGANLGDAVVLAAERRRLPRSPGAGNHG